MDSENITDEPCRGHGLPRSLLVDHAAALLGVSRRTVYNRIHEGRLKTIRTPSGSQRVLLESLEALLRHMRGESKARGASDALKAESLTLEVQPFARDAKRSGGGVDLAAMLVQRDLDHFALDFRKRGH